MIQQECGAIKTCVTQERGKGKIDKKKETKGDVGGGFAAKKCDATHPKKRDFASDVLFDTDLFYCIFYECIC